METEVILKFDSIGELQDWAKAQNAQDALFEFAQYLRTQRKHVEEKDQADLYKIEERFFEICEENDVEF